MQDFTAYVHTVTNQVHEDINAAVSEGGLPEGATDSVDTHKTLICMHVLNGLRSESNYDGEVNYDAIERVVDRQINAVID